MSSPFGTLAVIVDPTAGRGRVGDQLAVLQRSLASQGLDFTISVASRAETVAGLAAQALDEGYRYLVAVGDDATVQGVVNGMFREGRPIAAEPVLGIVPATTGCDLVKSFGLPGDTEGASQHLGGDNTYPFDVFRIRATDAGGSIVERYAHNMVEVGLHAAATSGAARLPRGFGNARRFLGFWRAYLGSGARSVRLRTDAKTWEGCAWSVILGNGQFADGGVRMSPRSFPGDGVIDALVFTGPRSDAYRMLPRMFRHGDHIPDPNITELRAKISVTIEADRPMPVVADGEPLGRTPVSIQMVPQQILLKL
jgi:diacylglycerol kinase family enzyme